MKLIVASLLLAVTSMQASAVTVDFEEPVETDGILGSGLPSIVRSQGFEFYSGGGFQLFGGPTPTIGLYYCPGCTAQMQAVSGMSFNLESLDIAIPFPAPGENPITVTGYYASGNSVSVDLAPGSGSNWANYTFGAGWQNLYSVDFGSSLGGGPNAVGLDNIVVSTVPIPAAAWLFGSALLGLGWVRKRAALHH